MLNRLLALLHAEPAAVSVAASGIVVALIVAFSHLSGTRAGYLSAGVTAAGTIVTALLARPVNVAVIGGAAGTVLESLALFGVHMTSGQIAAVVAAVNLVLGYLVMRPALTPVTRPRPGAS
ncbi:MAG TPA: hypothetical protein VFB06_11500 [Streptosporangiaceae bacterium]|nr:hypothetical protein [Streptosporangiaceae bacterium]